MSEWLILLIIIVYLGIGVIFNGAMNEEREKFSLFLMLFWPLALAMLLLAGFFTLMLGIGEKIKEKWL